MRCASCPRWSIRFGPTSPNAGQIYNILAADITTPTAYVLTLDRVVLGYVRSGEILEVAAQDANQGIVFYTLEQKAGGGIAQFQRVTTCLGCHLNADTLGVPGLLMFSTLGPDTLRDFRSAWPREDGHSHTLNFADMHNLGDALVSAGFVEAGVIWTILPSL